MTPNGHCSYEKTCNLDYKPHSPCGIHILVLQACKFLPTSHIAQQILKTLLPSLNILPWFPVINNIVPLSHPYSVNNNSMLFSIVKNKE